MKLKNYFILFFTICTLPLIGQSEYQLITYAEPYIPLTDTTSLTEGEVWDDPYYIVPVGFEFQFFDLTYDTLYSKAAIGAFLSPDKLTGGIPLIIPYGSDIADRGHNDGISKSDICYKLTGEIGSRILKMEWKNVGFYKEQVEQDTSISYTNFQLWIYETSSDIEFRYGESYTPDFEYVHGGDSGLLIALSDSIGIFGSGPGQVLHLEGLEDIPELTTVPSVDLFDNYNLVKEEPINGRVYRLTTQVTPTVNIENNNSKFYPSHGSTTRFLEIGEGLVSQNLNYRIVNVSGQVMDFGTIQSDKTIFDVSELPAGLYYFSLSDKQTILYNFTFLVN